MRRSREDLLRIYSRERGGGGGGALAASLQLSELAKGASSPGHPSVLPPPE